MIKQWLNIGAAAQLRFQVWLFNFTGVCDQKFAEIPSSGRIEATATKNYIDFCIADFIV